jgi:Flp pilus assembly protein TadD
MGYAYYKLGEYGQAETYLNRAIAIDSSDPDQFIYLALAQLRLGRSLDATGNAERAIQRGPQSPGYHYILGMILEARGDRARAMAEFLSELSAHPANASARSELQRLQSSQ